MVNQLDRPMLGVPVPAVFFSLPTLVRECVLNYQVIHLILETVFPLTGILLQMRVVFSKTVTFQRASWCGVGTAGHIMDFMYFLRFSCQIVYVQSFGRTTHAGPSWIHHICEELFILNTENH